MQQVQGGLHKCTKTGERLTVNKLSVQLKVLETSTANQRKKEGNDLKKKNLCLILHADSGDTPSPTSGRLPSRVRAVRVTSSTGLGIEQVLSEYTCSQSHRNWWQSTMALLLVLLLLSSTLSTLPPPHHHSVHSPDPSISLAFWPQGLLTSLPGKFSFLTNS